MKQRERSMTTHRGRHRALLAAPLAALMSALGPAPSGRTTTAAARRAARVRRERPRRRTQAPCPRVPIELATWWRALGDTELDSLVDRAIKSNLDLSIALDRLQQARTYEVVVAGHALPEVDASGIGGAWHGNGSRDAAGRPRR